MSNNSYIGLNSQVNFYGEGKTLQLEKDKEAVKAYFLEHVNPNTVFFYSVEERLDYLVTEGYYESDFLAQYSKEFLNEIYTSTYKRKFRFRTFTGAYKFTRQYSMRTWDGERYLERYEDRVVANALYLAQGDEKFAKNLVDEIITGRFQPATPTFLNAGRAQRGELVSCYLVDVADDMNSIGRAQNTALQLSKRGGGISFNLTNLRGAGDPIKGMAGQASGVVPVMKILEDCIKYSNQLGQRDGSAAVYLNVFHSDIEVFLDSRRENADDAIRINKLSLGIVVPDIFFELCKNDEDMYLFSPYDVTKAYGVDFSEIDVTQEYRSLVDNRAITKKKIRARTLLTRIAETQIESGYPYILYVDTANKVNDVAGKIKMSNLCSEIIQVQTPSVINDDQTYATLGKDISCNLGSINIAKVMKGGGVHLPKTVSVAVRALSVVSDLADIGTAPSIDNGNKKSRAIGLGAMNLHGFLAENDIEYGSEESLDFINVYFANVKFWALSESNDLATERGSSFEGFDDSKFASGEALKRYVEDPPTPKTDKVKDLFPSYTLSASDWQELSDDIQMYGLYNQNLQAVAPTGSISYINDATASLLPVTAKIETRKEGMMGQVYWPAPGLTTQNQHLYKDGYEVGWKAIVDVYAAAQPHIDQGMSCTLFFGQNATTAEINKAQIYAWRKGLKTLYYTRIKMNVMNGLDDQNCVSCAV